MKICIRSSPLTINLFFPQTVPSCARGSEIRPQFAVVSCAPIGNRSTRPSIIPSRGFLCMLNPRGSSVAYVDSLFEWRLCVFLWVFRLTLPCTIVIIITNEWIDLWQNDGFFSGKMIVMEAETAINVNVYWITRKARGNDCYRTRRFRSELR